jgi:hypothetical protein
METGKTLKSTTTPTTTTAVPATPLAPPTLPPTPTLKPKPTLSPTLTTTHTHQHATLAQPELSPIIATPTQPVTAAAATPTIIIKLYKQ